MYAIIDYKGNQILLKEGTQVRIPFAKECKVGSKIKFENVLFYDDGSKKTSGDPFVKNLNFEAKVISHEKDSKILVFKQKRRKGYQKKNGYRDDYTLVQVDKLTKVKKIVKVTKKNSPKKTTSKAKTTKK
jgi:large subunit ribosomal protein L21